MSFYRPLVVGMVVVIGTVLIACGASGEANDVEGEPMGGENYPPVVAMAAADLAQRLSVEVREVIVAELLSMEWSDSCLGVHYGDRVCAQVITPGYWVVLEANGKEYRYHTDLDDHFIAVDFVQGATIAEPPRQPSTNLATPPNAVLLLGQDKQIGGVGSYCWSDGSTGVCVDMIGIPIPKMPLVADASATLTFELGFQPTRALLMVWPLASGQVVEDSGGFSFWQPRNEPALTQEHPTPSQRLDFALNLPPGRYAMLMYVAGQGGDVSYGFSLEFGAN